jgi:magnesium transporter
MEFKISKVLIQELEQLILKQERPAVGVVLNDMHHADIAEILDELDFNEATYIFKVF